MRDASALGVDAEMQIQNQPKGCKRTNKDPHNHRDRATRKLSQPPHHDHTDAIHKTIPLSYLPHVETTLLVPNFAT